jgi:hypothetical protein
MRVPGGVLPVNPSTFRIIKYLQKLDPSDYPSEAVRQPVRKSFGINLRLANGSNRGTKITAWV